LANQLALKITTITQQVKQKGRFSIFVDGQYAFSLSEAALLKSKIASGDKLTSAQLKALKKLS
jgi:regulatory protein